MSAKSPKKGLGRGFASLIPTELLDESFDPTAGEDERISDLRNIKISEITADPVILPFVLNFQRRLPEVLS